MKARAAPPTLLRALFALGAGAFFLSAGAGLAWSLFREQAVPVPQGEADVIRDLDDLRAAAALQPRNPVAVAALGSALYAEGDSLGATRVLEKALKLNPTPVRVHVQLAALYYRQGRIELARRQARAAHAKGGSVDPRLLRALGLAQGQR